MRKSIKITITILLILLLLIAAAGAGYYFLVYRSPDRTSDRADENSNESYERRLNAVNALAKSGKKRVFINVPYGGDEEGIKLIDPERNVPEIIECDLLLDIAMKVKELNNDPQVVIILSREGDISYTAEQRLTLLQTADPDMIIDIYAHPVGDVAADNGVDPSDEGGSVGISSYYNGLFYRYDLDNQTFAGLCSDKIAVRCGLDALAPVDITEAEETLEYPVFDLIRGRQVPAVLVELGDLNDKGWAQRFSDPALTDQVAEGLAEAIREGFESLDTEITTKLKVEK
ncbi:MAG: N-acetylmuramoyl-L-alanine amidase [Lachnospiraceae bacterium]|nr:N-acetylmuramoyl-L-alanine amidase [Lachnospiraceae bacterium]